jgi:D-alanyl-D-alanine carboxypeptidase (penicillin-binding protein 5/6)
MLQLMRLMYQGELVSRQASQQMLAHMRASQDNTKLAAALPDGVVIAHKGGTVSKVRCDAGIIESPAGPIAVCVLTAAKTDRRWSGNNAERLCAGIARRTFDHFNPPWEQGTTTTPAPFATGSSGRLVEHLQRTLNLRLNPSSELNIDGDFGPATQAAVARFQKSRQLEVSGVVDARTWEALGPLVTSPTPVPDPGIINGEKLESAPEDSLEGRPFVTCRAWAIADGRTGELLWGNNESARLDIASTTKIMTAWLIIRLSSVDATVLDETLTFSRRADNTPGSTSGIRTGESIEVRDALYGLLLPSGNDASVALAEHFGNRLHQAHAVGADDQADPDDGVLDDHSSESDPLALFVAAMNREADRLGMAETNYLNPHGLTAEGHVSSARDLLKLASTAFMNKTFQRYVSTRQRGCRVTAADGYTRNVHWKNTNRLLGIDGYLGVKTGTTSAAGACLVSLSQRGDDRLLLVVLGSAASDSRYIDSRNLYRWAWRKRIPFAQSK